MILNALAIQAAFIELTGKAAGMPGIDPNQGSADMEKRRLPGDCREFCA